MKKRLLFIVDSYPYKLHEALEGIGLTHHDYDITGAGGAQVTKIEQLKAEKLLVFMSSFHGTARPAEEMVRKIREEIPNAVIIWRSTQGPDNPDLFDEVMEKEFDGHPKLLEIVCREFDITPATT